MILLAHVGDNVAGKRRIDETDWRTAVMYEDDAFERSNQQQHRDSDQESDTDSDIPDEGAQDIKRKGTKGAKSAKSTKSARGAKGDKGDKGDKGKRGERGEPGERVTDDKGASSVAALWALQRTHDQKLQSEQQKVPLFLFVFFQH
jgi:hypothetical protein